MSVCSRRFRKLVALVSAIVLLPATIALATDDAQPTAAVTPNAYIERSKVVATGKQIKAYGVPTRDSNGVFHYYDITIPLTISTTGKPNSTANVNAVLSPSVNVNDFLPGTYKAEDVTCTLVASPFGGRTEVTMNCVEGSYILYATWYTGPVKGNPFEAELSAANIGAVPGSANYAWGKVGNNGNRIWWGCFTSPDIIAARQTGKTLTIFSYGDDSVSDCQVVLTKTTP